MSWKSIAKMKAKGPERFPHGTRARYTVGCRCDVCRAANTAYEAQRTRRKIRGTLDGMVSAHKARLHLLMLSSYGVGKSAVAYATDFSRGHIGNIRSGNVAKIKKSTAEKIMAVGFDCRADRSYVPTEKSKKMVDWMLKHGWTKRELGKALGLNYKNPSMVFWNQITVRRERKIEKLYKEAVQALKEYVEVCGSCGRSHKKKHRLPRLEEMLPCSVQDAKELWPCMYGGTAGDRALYRDLREIRASADTCRQAGGIWRKIG